MNTRTLRHDWLGGRAGLGLLGALMILGLGCGSSSPAAQEPEPEPVKTTEPAREPAAAPANEPAPDEAVAAGNEPAAEQAQADAPQPGQLDVDEPRTTPATPAAAPEPTGKLAQLIEDSAKAGQNQEFGKAHRLCSQALDMEPGQPRAVMLCAIAACNLGNKRLSQKYYEMAEAERQQPQIYQICLSKGIELRK